MSTHAWVMLSSYCMLAVLVALVVLIDVVRRLSVRPSAVVIQPERCASCGGVLPNDIEPVEFSGVPVPILNVNSTDRELTVRFKVCQGCVAVAQL